MTQESFINVYGNGKLGGEHPTREAAASIASVDFKRWKVVYRLRVRFKEPKCKVCNSVIHSSGACNCLLASMEDYDKANKSLPVE